jgi:hypothetical protein
MQRIDEYEVLSELKLVKPAMMIDLETFGTSPRAEVAQIGLIIFDLETNYFARRWNVKPQGREIDRSTVKWWLMQSEDARTSLFDRAPLHPLGLLGGIRQLWEMNKCNAVWANRIDFELAIMENLAEQYDSLLPWSSSQKCCLRGLRRIGPSYTKFRKQFVVKEAGHVPHNALHDCTVQVEYLRHVIKLINEGRLQDER